MATKRPYQPHQPPLEPYPAPVALQPRVCLAAEVIRGIAANSSVTPIRRSPPPVGRRLGVLWLG